MELGSWSLITAPSLLALIPLIVMIVLVFRGKSNVSGMMVGIILGALMDGSGSWCVGEGVFCIPGIYHSSDWCHYYDGSWPGCFDDRDWRDSHAGLLDR